MQVDLKKPAPQQDSVVILDCSNQGFLPADEVECTDSLDPMAPDG